MCGAGDLREEELDLDKELLKLWKHFVQFSRNLLTEEENKETADSQFTNGFYAAVQDRLPKVLEMEKKGELEE
jgi:hypothetical protein